MPSPLDTRLDNLLRPHGWMGRVLVTGWFSILDGEVTAGDALAQRAASRPRPTGWASCTTQPGAQHSSQPD